ncbi:hypothetical protein GCM10008934_10290 [Virgibacillus salarius]|uniref:glycosyl transferase family 2 n=1 Tax=Virgibacillus salarius TaxID=447199 RepID=UPI0031E13871
MFNEHQSIQTDYKDLSNAKFNTTKPFLLVVNKNGVKYEFFIRINKKSPKLLIFGSGAYKPSTMSLPVFQRHSWTEDMEESIIFYNDPTLYLDRLMLGWGFGDLQEHYLEVISDIIRELCELFNYGSDDTFYYGSSAGGFMSLMLSTMMKGSTAIVNNPQTIFTNYQEVHVNKLMRALNITKEIAENKYKDRVNTIHNFKKYNHVPKIKYLQNSVVEHDVNNHLIPFISGLKDIDESIITNKLQVDLYFDHKLGHNPVGKKATIQYIKDALY